ncbi:MAG: N-acetylmuramoyl-L-alanine amidase [Cetobacterium sp.]
MTHSPLTNQIRLSNQSSSRQGAKIDTFLIHHQAGTNDDAVINAMISGSRQVSSNYTISNEGRITLVVDEDLRAWTSGSSSDGGKGAAWDRRAITVEIENESGSPDWRISAAALDAAARLLRDVRQRYGTKITLGHRDLWTQYRASYATYCPGPETVAAIVARAGTVTDAPAPAPIPSPSLPPVGSGFTTFGGAAGKTAWRGIQQYLAREWGYSGLIDGIPGKLTWLALQAFVKTHWGYQGTIDGAPGKMSWSAVQRWLKSQHGYTGIIDGIPGPLTYGAMTRAGRALWKAPSTVLPRTQIDGVPGKITWRRAQTWLARDWGYSGPIDGLPGSFTWRAMQRFLAANWKYTGAVDGVPGPLTYKAMQRWLKASWGYQGIVDGKPGPMTWSAFQRFVNSV